MSDYIECCRCGRRLRSAASKEIGYGPACARFEGVIPSKFRGKAENAAFSVGIVRDGAGSFCLAYFTGTDKKDALAKHPAFLGDRLSYYFDVRELWSQGNESHIQTFLFDKEDKLYTVKLYQQKDLFDGYSWIADLQEVTAPTQVLLDLISNYLEKAKV